MKKIFIRIMVLIGMVMMANGAVAQQLTEQQAKERAGRFLKERRSQEAGGGRQEAGVRREGVRREGVTLAAARVEAKSIYAFNCEGGGYAIASADSRALPVLGYSDTGSIDWERMPENMRVWLKLYDEAIATLGNRQDFKDGDMTGSHPTSRNGTQRQTRMDARTAVEPLIKTNWYQIVPYYNECPLYDGADSSQRGKRCLTGCTATATAQVMNYYQWPQEITDSLPGYDIETTYKDEKKVWHIDALPPVTFAWQDVLDCYLEPRDGSLQPKEIHGTEAQQQAVATLMRYCGQAMKTTYGPAASATSTDAQYAALVKVFGYTAATKINFRTLYTIDEWEDIIYGELAAGRPVLYHGYSESEGHSFVCDGYDGDGLFHINWGWGGKDDGYFSLSVLNPYNNTSAGSGSSGIGFSINQGAVIYLDPMMDPQPSPDEGKPELFQYEMSLEDNHTVRFTFGYRKDDAGIATVDNAIGIRNDDGEWTPVFMGDLNDSIIYSNNYMLVEVDSMAFLPGESLRLHPMYRFRHGYNTEWQMIPPEEYSLMAGRTEEGAFYLHILFNECDGLECIGGAITKGTGVVGERSDVTVTVRNNNPKDYAGELCLVPYYNDDEEGDTMSCGAYLQAEKEGEVTFSFVPRHEGSVTLMLKSPSGYPLGSFTLETHEATGIEKMESGKRKEEREMWKEESGVRNVESLLLPKGIYIQDGKKFLRK
ncbi:MAG: C10 family peptidase [Prevotella sp.]|nr:C10 family peptidase [Prevotella sp.]